MHARAIPATTVGCLMTATLMNAPVAAHAVPDAQMAVASATVAKAKAAPEVMGIASFAGLPLRGAKVSVRTTRGKRIPLVGAQRRTGKYGHIHVRVKHLPRVFVLEVTGGRYGTKTLRGTTLASIGDAKESGEYVNAGTTIMVNHLLGGSSRRSRVNPAVAMGSAKRIARFLGLPKPQRLLSIGQFTHVRFSAFDPKLLAKKANKAPTVERYLASLAQEARSPRVTHTFRPKHNAKVSSAGASLAEDCEGITGCILSSLGSLVSSLVGAAAQAGVCQVGESVPLVASLGGCTEGNQIAAILELLTQMQQQLNEMQAQLNQMSRMLANQAQATAFNYSQISQLQLALSSWQLDLTELASPSVDVNPIPDVPLAVSTLPSDLCAAAYTSGSIPSGFTQSPYQACVDAAKNSAGFLDSWFKTILNSMTGFTRDISSDDLLIPGYQNALTGGGVQMITGTEQNALNQMIDSFVGLQATAFQYALAWQTFQYAWTGQPPTCPSATLPDSFENPTAFALLTSSPCNTALTAMFVVSLQEYIGSQYGPRTSLPNEVVIDAVNASNQADVPVWWAYPVDISSWTAGFSSTWPYYPGFTGNYTNNPLASPTSPVQITSKYPDTFTFSTDSQNGTLVSHVTTAYLKAMPSSTSTNNGLRKAGFVGVGLGEGSEAMPQGYGMWWANLGSGIQNWTFTNGGGCGGWPLIGNVYSCTAGVAGYVMNPMPAYPLPLGAGINGTYATTYQDLTGSSTGLNACSAGQALASWGNNPPPKSSITITDTVQMCPRASKNGSKNYYGLLVDTTPGDVLWTTAPFSAWQSDSVPALGD